MIDMVPLSGVEGALLMLMRHTSVNMSVVVPAVIVPVKFHSNHVQTVEAVEYVKRDVILARDWMPIL
jgi:hypothetical protein